jgi:thiol-disulfide isomerase/thioredoxin
MVEVVEDFNDFKTILSAERQNLVAVMFHAPFCKACQAASPHFHKLAKKYSKNVKFVSVPLTEANANLLKGLGVSKFPFGHIYDPEKGLVEELPMLRKLIPRFEEKLRTFVTAKNEPRN